MKDSRKDDLTSETNRDGEDIFSKRCPQPFRNQSNKNMVSFSVSKAIFQNVLLQKIFTFMIAQNKPKEESVFARE